MLHIISGREDIMKNLRTLTQVPNVQAVTCGPTFKFERAQGFTHAMVRTPALLIETMQCQLSLTPPLATRLSK